MFKIKYRNNIGSVVEASFEEYMDLVYFVAQQKIADDAVVSITVFGQEMSLFGLADKVMANIEAFKAAQTEVPEELDWDDEEDPDDDDSYPEDYDNDGFIPAEEEMSSQEEENLMAELNEELRKLNAIFG